MEPGTSSKVDGQNVGMPSKDRSGGNKCLAGRGQIKTGKINIEASLHMSRNMTVCDVEEDRVDLVQNDHADVKNFRNQNSKKKRNNCKGRLHPENTSLQRVLRCLEVGSREQHRTVVRLVVAIMILKKEEDCKGCGAKI